MYRTPYLTTMSATAAACDALIALHARTHSVRSLQEAHGVAADSDLSHRFGTPEVPITRRMASGS